MLALNWTHAKLTCPFPPHTTPSMASHPFSPPTSARCLHASKTLHHRSPVPVQSRKSVEALFQLHNTRLEVLSSEEQLMNLTSIGIKVWSPTKMITGVESMSDALTYVDTESGLASLSFNADIDSNYPMSSAFSMVCTCLPCSNAKLI